jgi:hypothetical protein
VLGLVDTARGGLRVILMIVHWVAPEHSCQTAAPRRAANARGDVAGLILRHNGALRMFQEIAFDWAR